MPDGEVNYVSNTLIVCEAGSVFDFQMRQIGKQEDLQYFIDLLGTSWFDIKIYMPWFLVIKTFNKCVCVCEIFRELEQFF